MLKVENKKKTQTTRANGASVKPRVNGAKGATVKIDDTPPTLAELAQLVRKLAQMMADHPDCDDQIRQNLTDTDFISDVADGYVKPKSKMPSQEPENEKLDEDFDDGLLSVSKKLTEAEAERLADEIFAEAQPFTEEADNLARALIKMINLVEDEKDYLLCEGIAAHLSHVIYKRQNLKTKPRTFVRPAKCCRRYSNISSSPAWAFSTTGFSPTQCQDSGDRPRALWP